MEEKVPQIILDTFKNAALAANATTPEEKAHYWDLVIGDDINNMVPKAWLEAGHAYFELDNYKEAMDRYSVAIKQENNIAEAYNGIGRIKTALQDYRGAIEDFTKAINVNVRFAEAFYNRAIAYSLTGENIRAVIDYTRAIHLKPTFFERGVKKEVSLYLVCDSSVNSFT